jgi:hypothetical protein
VAGLQAKGLVFEERDLYMSLVVDREVKVAPAPAHLPATVGATPLPVVA